KVRIPPPLQGKRITDGNAFLRQTAGERVDIFDLEVGSRRSFGTMWRGPARVRVSAGSGGVTRGCTGRSDSSQSTPLPTARCPTAFSDSNGPITLDAKRCRSA